MYWMLIGDVVKSNTYLEQFKKKAAAQQVRAKFGLHFFINVISYQSLKNRICNVFQVGRHFPFWMQTRKRKPSFAGSHSVLILKLASRCSKVQATSKRQTVIKGKGAKELGKPL